MRHAKEMARLSAVALGLGAFLAGCNSGGSSGADMVGKVGEELAKPSGGTFFNDSNEGGQASSVKVMDMLWGRLVDVYDIDATGATGAVPIFEDFLVGESVLTDGINFVLETNPVTLDTRLIIQRTKGAPDLGTGTFDDLLKQAQASLKPIQPKSDAPGIAPPFSFVPRNAAISIQFSDLLKDDATALAALPQHVKVLTSYPPTTPFIANRIFFDPNHGGLTSGNFHSTRILVDMTVSEAEAAAGGTGPINPLGMPASQPTTEQANVSVRMPSQLAPVDGVFSLLTNLSGSPLNAGESGPVDFGSSSLDVVRALRSGNGEDVNNGFLEDVDDPTLLGSWQVSIDAAIDDPAGTPGFQFIVGLRFLTPCRSQPDVGDTIELPGLFLEVTEPGVAPDGAGIVADLKVRALTDGPVTATSLLGAGEFQRPYEAGLLVPSLEACWMRFGSAVASTPGAGLPPATSVSLRFNEPMDPSSVQPFDTFLVSRVVGDPNPEEIVVGEVSVSPDARRFDFTPVLPLDHTIGTAEEYFVQLDDTAEGIRDLAGNLPASLPTSVRFELSPDAPTAHSGGFVLRFSSTDEVVTPAAAAGADDLTGQLIYDFQREVIRPRPVVRTSHLADASQTSIGLMAPIPGGVREPLSPQGSRMMTLWRHFDVGLPAFDYSQIDMDVEGMYWSSQTGSVISDFFPGFEMRLAHSARLPDESIDGMGNLLYPFSGMDISTFGANIHPDEALVKVVHFEPEGYLINVADQILSSTGTFLMPWPMNEDLAPEDFRYYTWRDSTIREVDGSMSSGYPTFFEIAMGLEPGEVTDTFATAGNIPSIGLPLLMEFRCYPDDGAIGINTLNAVRFVPTGFAAPITRIHATGGQPAGGAPTVFKDPDLQPIPDGGFNPTTGAPTAGSDVTFYVGQLDLVTRVSRVHTIWFDTDATGTSFLPEILDPPLGAQPDGTSIEVAWRGASSIQGASLADYAFDSDHIGPYGDVRGPDELLGDNADVLFINPGDDGWQNFPSAIVNSRYLQLRITFISNAVSALGPELSSLGVAYTSD